MTYVESILKKYGSRELLLDSNLLLLYLVGKVDPALVGVGSYNKLSGFAVEQLTILDRLVARFKRLVTTAHILTEVSNHVGAMHKLGRARVFDAFAGHLELIREESLSSYRAARRKEFRYLGLTDTVLAELGDKYLIVSNDGRMVDILRRTGLEALKWVEVLQLSTE